MSCYFRILGKDLDPDLLLARTGLKPYSIWRRGELRVPFKPERGLKEASGIGIEVSVAPFSEFSKQKEDAVNFLSKFKAGLGEINKVPGVEVVCMDFGVAYNLGFQFYDLPPELMKLAAEFGITIEISVYPIDNDSI